MGHISREDHNLIRYMHSGGKSGKEFGYQGRRHKECAFDPWVGKIPGGGNSNPLQYSCLENPMDRGAWQAQSMGLQELDTT